MHGLRYGLLIASWNLDRLRKWIPNCKPGRDEVQALQASGGSPARGRLYFSSSVQLALKDVADEKRR